MVVCKFFLQGYCKFGENCRYQHYENNGGNSQIANYQSQNRSWQSPGYAQARSSSQVSAFQRSPQTAPGQLNPLDLCAAIKEDITSMEEGGQWPLSCYTPLKDIGCFPGFHDTSMEEVRYDAYQAQISGTFEQYVKKMSNSIQATRMKWAMLKNPSGQVMSVIEKMARGQMGGSLAQSGSSFSLQPSALSPSGNFPAIDQSPAASNFTFSLPSSDPAPPAFGQSAGMVFGFNNATPGVPATDSMGGGDMPSAGFFGNRTVFEATPQAEGSNVWSNNAPQKTNLAALADINVYSNLADLSDAEKKEFSAMTFTLGFVPVRPPPHEMCT